MLCEAGMKSVSTGRVAESWGCHPFRAKFDEFNHSRDRCVSSQLVWVVIEGIQTRHSSQEIREP